MQSGISWLTRGLERIGSAGRELISNIWSNVFEPVIERLRAAWHGMPDNDSDPNPVKIDDLPPQPMRRET